MHNKSFFMCSCHLEIIITLKLYDLSSAISKFDVHILTSKTSEISNVNNTMDAMEQELLMDPWDPGHAGPGTRTLGTQVTGPKCWDPYFWDPSAGTHRPRT